MKCARRLLPGVTDGDFGDRLVWLRRRLPLELCVVGSPAKKVDHLHDGAGSGLLEHDFDPEVQLHLCPFHAELERHVSRVRLLRVEWAERARLAFGLFLPLALQVEVCEDCREGDKDGGRNLTESPAARHLEKALACVHYDMSEHIKSAVRSMKPSYD